MRAHAHGAAFALGRNERGHWIVGSDGHTVNFDQDRAWPRWLGLDGGVVLLDSVDHLLTSLGARYELSHEGTESLGGPDGRTCDRIVAEGSAPADADPDRIDVWIDPDTRIVHRMELRWAGPHEHAHAHPPSPEALHRGPHVLSGTPRFGAGHAAAPHLMVFELADTPEFPSGWFDAATHGR